MNHRIDKGTGWLLAGLLPLAGPLLLAAIIRPVIGEPWLAVLLLCYASGYVALYFAYRPRWRHLLLAFAGLTFAYAATWWPLAVIHFFLGCVLFGACV